MNKGTLSSHKTYCGKVQQTLVRLTGAGRNAFEQYCGFRGKVNAIPG